MEPRIAVHDRRRNDAEGPSRRRRTGVSRCAVGAIANSLTGGTLLEVADG
jgi:hypothetical protein